MSRDDITTVYSCCPLDWKSSLLAFSSVITFAYEEHAGYHAPSSFIGLTDMEMMVDLAGRSHSLGMLAGEQELGTPLHSERSRLEILFSQCSGVPCLVSGAAEIKVTRTSRWIRLSLLSLWRPLFPFASYLSTFLTGEGWEIKDAGSVWSNSPVLWIPCWAPRGLKWEKGEKRSCWLQKGKRGGPTFAGEKRLQYAKWCG